MSRHARIEIRPAMARDSWNKRYVPMDPHLAPAQRPHYLRLVAANGQVLAHSENYANRQNARRAVEAWRLAFSDVLNGLRGDGERWSPAVVEFDADGNEVAR